MNDNPEDIFKPLLDFIAKEIEKEQRITDDEMKPVIEKLRSLPVRERQLIQDAAITGYYLGYTDRANSLPGMTNGALVCARAVSKCMGEPDVFVAVNGDPESDSLLEEHNRRLTRELEATQKAKRENDERFGIRIADLEQQLREARGEIESPLELD